MQILTNSKQLEARIKTLLEDQLIYLQNIGMRQNSFLDTLEELKKVTISRLEGLPAIQELEGISERLAQVQNSAQSMRSKLHSKHLALEQQIQAKEHNINRMLQQQGVQ